MLGAGGIGQLHQPVVVGIVRAHRTSRLRARWRAAAEWSRAFPSGRRDRKSRAAGKRRCGVLPSPSRLAPDAGRTDGAAARARAPVQHRHRRRIGNDQIHARSLAQLRGGNGSQRIGQGAWICDRRHSARWARSLSTPLRLSDAVQRDHVGRRIGGHGTRRQLDRPACVIAGHGRRCLLS